MTEYTDNLKYDIIKNPDEKFYEKITAAVERNGYYCPCLIKKSKETLCICEDMRNKFPDIENGEYECFCHCKRFKKVLKPEYRQNT